MSTPSAPSIPATPLRLGPGLGDLYLIDTMGYIFRAFHALPPLTNSRGLPTQAVLGMANMLRKLLQEAAPPALAAVMDAPGPTFRETSFADYKANREAMPDDLARQLPYIRRLLEAFRIPTVEFAGYEADDVIGTLAARAAAAGQRVVIVSSDKDLMQLVADGVMMFHPGRNEVMDAERVRQALGVRPAQVPDLLALRGDSIDNIPGAPGIGEKGAQMLIERFGSVTEALERAAEVERKSYRESLQANREVILLSRELATIHTQVPIEFTPEAWRCQAPDLEQCRELFGELEFHQLLRAISEEQGAAAATPATGANAPARAATARASGEMLAEFLARRATEPMALAVGGSELAPEIGLAAVGEAPLLVTPEGGVWPAALATALSESGRRWQWSDSRAVRAGLRRVGLPLPTLDAERIDDVALLAFAVDPTQNSYEAEAIQRRMGVSETAADAGELAAWVARAAPELRQRAEALGALGAYSRLDLPLVPVLEEMESTGISVDRRALDELSATLRERCTACEEAIFALAGVRFNVNSPRQLGEILFEKMGLPAPPRRGKTQAPSTAMDVLEELSEHEVVKHVLEFRQVSKLRSTYAEALPPLMDAAGRVHTTFVITGAATGRLASTNPNLQNIPIRSELGRQIRAAFRAGPGLRLLAADYSQIELRLLAHFSQDALLLDAFRRDVDVHELTASEVFGVSAAAVDADMRRRAKAVNFGIVYGLSAFGLARQLGIPQGEAARFIQRYFERYAGVKQYLEQTLAEARRRGQVSTLLGRVRPIPNLDARNVSLRGFAERTAINTPLQGTAADLIKLAMIRLQPGLDRLGARLLLQVHDELVLEVPAARMAETAALLRQTMETVADLSVPLVVELGAGENWRDLEPLA